MIKNTLNPEFAKVIMMDYRFEEVQKLKFSVFDIDNETADLGDDDFLGSLECTLGEVRVWTTYYGFDPVMLMSLSFHPSDSELSYLHETTQVQGERLWTDNSE